METIHFTYNDQAVDFLPSGNDELMVNATQMAKIFGKRVDVFLKSDHANAFINALELTPYGGSLTPLRRDEIIKTINGVNTWMHRILALKFAAWLDPKFEVWVFSTIDQIILGHYKEQREATLEKLKAEQEVEAKRKELLEKYPEFLDYLKLEGRVSEADKRRAKAIKESAKQIRLDFIYLPQE
jgi:hypothetical protein